MKRTKEIKIRLTNDEYLNLLKRKTKPRLAQWLRELALDQETQKPPKTIDPKLLFELNRIGVNLNQIARFCNRESASIDLINVAVSLRNIEDELKKVREENHAS